MGKQNVGQTGEESVRIGGREVSELSVRDQMTARKGIALTKKQLAIKEIKDKYPKWDVNGLLAAIRQADDNIERFEKCLKEERATIAEYTGYVALCKQRDDDLRKVESD
tara:strand:+ start:672 stop:998 length:327 start_codon:yes stop_codon:yes gene_type:complete